MTLGYRTPSEHLTFLGSRPDAYTTIHTNVAGRIGAEGIGASQLSVTRHSQDYKLHGTGRVSRFAADLSGLFPPSYTAISRIIEIIAKEVEAGVFSERQKTKQTAERTVQRNFSHEICCESKITRLLTKSTLQA